MDETNSENQIKITQFLDEDGRITKMPRKNAPRLAVLAHLAEKFETGCDYTEHEVNDICDEWSTINDYFLLRRELVDCGQLCRERDGSKYWRPESEPSEEQK